MSSNAIELIERFESMAWNYGINPERREKLAAALYEAVLKCKPKGKNHLEEEINVAEENYRLGYDDGVEAFLTNLSLLFGVEDVGNLATPEATNSQPQLADNPSECKENPHGGHTFDEDGQCVHCGDWA